MVVAQIAAANVGQSSLADVFEMLTGAASVTGARKAAGAVTSVVDAAVVAAEIVIN